MVSTTEPPGEQLSGLVERVTFHSEESGFCVLRVKIRGQRDLVTVVGTVAVATPGEFLEWHGEWQNDRHHGVQFRAHELRVLPPSTVEGIEKYLGSGMVKGIGPHFANKLVRAFGVAVFDIIETTPERLTELEGTGPKFSAAAAVRFSHSGHWPPRWDRDPRPGRNLFSLDFFAPEPFDCFCARR